MKRGNKEGDGAKDSTMARGRAPRRGSGGAKMRITLGLNTGAILNCADNSGGKNLYTIAVKGTGARLNRLPAASLGDMLMSSVKKGKPELRNNRGKRLPVYCLFYISSVCR
ncbi:60S ribosomal protein L23 [Perkinsus olseni]|uniref:60S ribosomal protein L23 n=1 Tax=Perkinsus olseni TaxID=32597 RepID=A0A7J6SWX1_PEROL|nr:60S ribosomal protein L23 [Perkinsus olseni]